MRSAWLLAMLVACGSSSGGPTDGGLQDDGPPVDGQEPAMRLPFRGTNLSGAEFGSAIPGTIGTDYVYPDAMYASGYTSPAYFRGKGATMFRLPFRWPRLQRTLGGELDAAEAARLDATVAHLTQMGAHVLIDPHDFARYGSDVIGSAAVPDAMFADLWARLAARYGGNSLVVFGLMNEPHDMPTEQWASAANAAIAAIRAAGAHNLITVPGNAYTGAWSWTSNYYGTPNGDAMLAITDPENNVAFEVHQYFDDNYSGTSESCTHDGGDALAALTAWLVAHHKKAIVGELGAAANATCATDVDHLLAHLEAHSDVYLGWLWWSAGPWWGNYFMTLEPTGATDAAQMATLAPHFAFH